jgi:fumarate hydratase class II
MTYTKNAEKLKQLKAQLAEQDAAIDGVRTALEDLDPRALVQMASDWSEAFEAATEMVPTRPHYVPNGALRA